METGSSQGDDKQIRSCCTADRLSIGYQEAETRRSRGCMKHLDLRAQAVADHMEREILCLKYVNMY